MEEENTPSRRRRSKSATPQTEEERKAKKREYDKAYRAKSANKVKDAQRKRDQRAKMSDSEKESVRKKDREYKSTMRQKLPTSENIEQESEEPVEFHALSMLESEKRMKAVQRKDRTEPEAEFERLQLCIRMRRLRMKRTGKEHLLDNLVAKRGMRDAREIGYLKDFQQRNPRELSDETLWYRFWCKGKEYRTVLRLRLEEMARKFTEKEEKEREEYEKKREEEEKRRKIGFWDYNPGDDCYHWTGDGPSPCSFEEYNGLGEYDLPDMKKILMEMSPEERRKRSEEADREAESYKSWWNDMIEEEKLERKRKAKEKRDQIKAQLNAPIEMPSEASEELSEYEKLREANMKELEELKKASGLFDD